jgi:hypothetical protein
VKAALGGLAEMKRNAGSASNSNSNVGAKKLAPKSQQIFCHETPMTKTIDTYGPISPGSFMEVVSSSLPFLFLSFFSAKNGLALLISASVQGCQMVYFQTKNHNLGKFLKVLQLQILVFFWPFCLFYGQTVYFTEIWYILWSPGIFFPVLVCCTDKNLATLAGRNDHFSIETLETELNCSKSGIQVLACRRLFSTALFCIQKSFSERTCALSWKNKRSIG